MQLASRLTALQHETLDAAVEERALRRSKTSRAQPGGRDEASRRLLTHFVRQVLAAVDSLAALARAELAEVLGLRDMRSESAVSLAVQEAIAGLDRRSSGWRKGEPLEHVSSCAGRRQAARTTAPTRRQRKAQRRCDRPPGLRSSYRRRPWAGQGQEQRRRQTCWRGDSSCWQAAGCQCGGRASAR